MYSMEIWYHLVGFEEEQQNPDLFQFTNTETKPPAKHVKKTS